MKKLRTLSLAVCLAALCACAPAAPATPSPSPTPAPTPTPVATPVWGRQTFSHAFTAGDQTVVLSASYSLPAIENDNLSPAWRAVSDWYAAEGEALLENAAEQAGWAVDDYLSSSAFGAEFSAYSDTQTFALTHLSDDYVSVLRTHVMDLDGASPFLFYYSDLFDLSTGERLTLTQCFTLPEEEARARILDQVLTLSAEGAYGDEIFSRDQLEDFFNPALFYFDENGLVIPLQIYRSGKYTSLIPDRAIPYSELEELLAIW